MKIKMNKKGFTLIELLIVVAIIAILAAIAIPQFGAYRVRGYNSAANSDLRNFKIAEESFKSDTGVYASTGAGGVAGAGARQDGPTTVSILVGVATIGTFPSSPTTLNFGLSNGVLAAVHTTATTAANYLAIMAHTQGNVIYAADSNITALKQAGKTVGGTAIVIGDTTQVTGGPMIASAVAASTDVDDLPTTVWSYL